MTLWQVLKGSGWDCQRCRDKGSGFWQESYAEKLWTEELHHVFTLETCVLDTFHHVFALDLCFGRYLGHVSDASGSLCLVAVSYLDIWCFMF